MSWVNESERSWQAAFLAALPHLVLALLTGLTISSMSGWLLPIMVIASFLFAWWQGWPLWSGSWAGYWLVFALIGASSWLPSLPGLELLMLVPLLVVGVFIFQRRPLYGLLASSPLLLLLPRFFVFELVTGGEWVWSGLWLLLALTAGAIVWLGSLRTGILLTIGFQLLAGLAFAAARSYLPFRGLPGQMVARQTPTLPTLVNDFVPLTLAVITISLALLLLQPLGWLAGQGGHRGQNSHRLLLFGMLLTVGGVFALREQPHLLAMTSVITSLAVTVGLVLALTAAFLLARSVRSAQESRFYTLLVPLLAALSPLVIFALAPPFAPDGRYSDRFQVTLFLSYVGVILWLLVALLVIIPSDRQGSSRLQGIEAGGKVVSG